MKRIPILAHTNPFMQFVTLLALWLFFLLTSMAITKIVGRALWDIDILSLATNADFTDPNHLRYLRFMQVVNQVATMILPPLILAFLISEKPWSWLSVNKKVSGVSLIIGVLLILAALPAIDLMGRWNLSMQLPESLSALEEAMLASEHMATELTESFMSQTSPWHLFSNLMMVGVLAAFGEELLFRVAFIRILTRVFRFKNPQLGIHLAVIISAFLFAALHMQFFTFLPRFVLGLLLGYLFVWSGSVWLPFIVHFVNNAFAVLAYYAWNKGITGYDPAELGSTEQSWVYLLSFGGAILMTGYIYLRNRPLRIESRE